MKILHINFSSKGGAGIGVNRLHNALKNRNIKSNVFNYDKFLKDKKNKFVSKYFLEINWKIKLLIKKVIVKFLVKFPNKEPLSLNIFDNLNFKSIFGKNNFDLIHLHWIGNEMMSIKEISLIDKPIIWTMHDMWPFSGGEHFNDGFRGQCYYSSKSRPKNEFGLDINRFVWTKKYKYFKNKKIKILCPSAWMLKKVKKSSLFKKHKTQVLPYIINTDKWNYNSKFCSKIIKPQNKIIILFSATSSVNFRKGFNFLADAINNHLDYDKYLLLVAGDKPKKFDDLKIQKEYLGILKSNRHLKNIYYSSDILVLPSLYESFGQVFIEAGCFGLPLVAFQKTAANEIIKHKKNGYLAKYKSSKDLAKGIIWAENKLKNSINFKKENRDYILENFSYKKRTEDYVTLYKEVIKNHSN